MATSTIQNEQLSLHAGENSLGNFVNSGYITGSGNYVGGCIPIRVPDNLTVTSMSFDYQNSHVYIITGVGAEIESVSSVSANQYRIIFELKNKSTLPSNTPATIYFRNLKINCS